MHTQAPLVDTHTHTRYSDGQNELIENVRAAKQVGCSILCTTDHLTLPAYFGDDAVGVQEEALGKLAEDIAQAREEVPEVELVYGFECDWYEGCEPNIAHYSAGASFRLGSVHMLGIHPIDWNGDMSVYEELGANGVWSAYADAWCKACESPAAFDSMAHPDLAMRFAREGWHASCDLTNIFRQMASCAHDCNKRIEVSTAALRKGVGTYYPNHELLVIFNKAEVPVTIGSDAHRSQDIANNILGAYAYAYSAGYRHIECPRQDGSWTRFKL